MDLNGYTIKMDNMESGPGRSIMVYGFLSKRRKRVKIADLDSEKHSLMLLSFSLVFYIYDWFVCYLK